MAYGDELILSKESVRDAGLYVAQEKDIGLLACIATDAYSNYPLHKWFMNNRYDVSTSKSIIQ